MPCKKKQKKNQIQTELKKKTKPWKHIETETRPEQRVITDGSKLKCIHAFIQRTFIKHAKIPLCVRDCGGLRNTITSQTVPELNLKNK